MEEIKAQNHKNNFFVLLFDSLWDNPIGRKPNYLAVFLFILSSASKKDYSTIINNEKFIVKRGQWLGSLLKIAEQFDISIGTVSNVVKYLKSESIIETKTTNKFTLFTVLNYDKYQPTIENKIENKLKTNRKQIESKDNVYNVNDVSNILSKDNILGIKPKNPKNFGNHLVNFVLEKFKKCKGFKPTDKDPRRRAWNLVQKVNTFIKNNPNLPEVVNTPEKLIEKYFNYLSKKDYFGMIEGLDPIVRKIEIYFGLIEKKIKERKIIEKIELEKEQPPINEEIKNKYEEQKKKFLEKFGKF